MNRHHGFHQSQDTCRRLPHINMGTALLVTVLVLCAVGLTPQKAPDGDSIATPAGKQEGVTLSRDCQVWQKMVYTPCGHELTRREPLPAALVGKSRTDAETAYPDWRITSFAQEEVQMTQQLDIHCPQHTVLRPDESGMLCVWENTYGDALKLKREMNIPLSDFPEETQDKLRTGLGFDSMDALGQWLENAES